MVSLRLTMNNIFLPASKKAETLKNVLKMKRCRFDISIPKWCNSMFVNVNNAEDWSCRVSFPNNSKTTLKQGFSQRTYTLDESFQVFMAFLRLQLFIHNFVYLCISSEIGREFPILHAKGLAERAFYGCSSLWDDQSDSTYEQYTGHAVPISNEIAATLIHQVLFMTCIRSQGGL